MGAMRSTALFYGLLLAAGIWVGEAHAEGIRLEATYGLCKYGKAEDGAWRKGGYPTHLDLTANCYGVGISQAKWPTVAGTIGYRVSYVDFGLAQADAIVPMRDDEANSYPTGNNCDTSTWSGCLGRYQQSGRARGISFGGLLEQKFRYGTFGVEGGFYYYRSNWHVVALLPYTDCGGSCQQQAWDWDGAAGYHLSPYLGVTYANHGFFVQARKYTAVYASQAHVTNNPLNVGLIAGPLWSVQAGYQFAF